MIKYIVIFIAGTIETFLFTGWSLSANKKQPLMSSFLMLLYMITYLFILDAAFKDTNSKLMIIDYALSCGLGNFIRVYLEKKHEKENK